MLKCGSVMVCSEECREGKLRAVYTSTVRRASEQRGVVDKSVVRAAVVKRDGNRCLLCATSESLHLHRVRYGSEGGRYEVDNCVLLCQYCHNAPSRSRPSVHSKKKVWQPLLLAYLAGEPGAIYALRRQLRFERSAE